MTKNEFIEHVHTEPGRFLEPDGSGRGWVCPICGSGTGKNGTGLTSPDGGRHFTCWRGCFVCADLFDIFGGAAHSFPEKVQILADRVGVVLETGREGAGSGPNLRGTAGGGKLYPNGTGGARNAVSGVPIACTGTAGGTECAETGREGVGNGPNLRGTAGGGKLYPNGTGGARNAVSGVPGKFSREELQAMKEYTRAAYQKFMIEETPPAVSEYLARRGLSRDDFMHSGAGYDLQFRHPKNPAGVPGPALIFPTSKGGYTARFINPAPGRAKVVKVGPAGLFYEAFTLSEAGPVVVVEGEIDAASVTAAGLRAVGLGGVAGVNLFLEELKKGTPAGPFVLALDNDEPGRKAEENLAQKLEGAGVAYIATGGRVYGAQKDANEVLAERGPGALLDSLNKVINKSASGYNEAFSAAGYLEKFREEIAAPETPAETGIAGLDSVLGGGLYSGLYIVGAVAALGKTTLLLQIADNVARAGRDVLIFSLEMARGELIAKSISRISKQSAGAAAGAFSAADILHKGTPGGLFGAAFDSAYSVYLEQIAPRAFIIEGRGEVSVAEIREAVARHITATGKTPAVFIDYMQILAPYAPGLTDKQSIDKTVLELKRLSRDFCTPVFTVSSFNRENYAQSVTMAAFKESGAIEYSADVLLGLQLFGTGGKGWNAEKAAEGMRKTPRTIEMRILKNRHGETGGRVVFHFFPRYNLFADITEALNESARG